MAKIVCFGEILWDVFPTHEKIGGAPLNVAYRLSSFGHQVSMISAVGNDNYGSKLIAYLKENKINTDCIQVLDNFETGKVQVTLDKEGSAAYNIKHPSAWDNIRMSPAIKTLIEKADAFIFGSLATRDETSRKTLFELIETSTYKIFDLNLRPPHYTIDILKHLMLKADFIKFNDEELLEVSDFMNSKYSSLEDNLRFIAKETNTQHLCVTKGKDGAVVLYEGEFYYNSGYSVNVVDTVGAGDSFLGTLISELLIHKSPQKAIDIACAVAAIVAQSEGANPKISKADIDDFVQSYLS